MTESPDNPPAHHETRLKALEEQQHTSQIEFLDLKAEITAIKQQLELKEAITNKYPQVVRDADRVTLTSFFTEWFEQNNVLATKNDSGLCSGATSAAKAGVAVKRCEVCKNMLPKGGVW